MSESSKAIPVSITEDEAALYDRQIRLWGLEAQQRMRNATILVIRLRGLAAEAIKNIVLAGIGELLIVDPESVTEEDLGAGFLFRDDDVGKKRVDAARPHIEALNPLVKIRTYADDDVLSESQMDQLLSGVDLVCMTDSFRQEMIKVNEACRRKDIRFYAGGCYGLSGFIFCDLLVHHHIAP
ncbi:hypothetical protein FRC02_002612 [Tulasnella sp. 418]|nr:hypothetical protein FRC02_002612 [Tulasnella sp. 418]